MRHYKYKDKRSASDKTDNIIRTASDLSTIQFDQFRLIFKGHINR